MAQERYIAVYPPALKLPAGGNPATHALEQGMAAWSQQLQQWLSQEVSKILGQATDHGQQIDALENVGKIKARAYRSAAQNIDATSATKVLIDTISFDTEGVVDIADSRIIPNLPGYYVVMGNVRASSVPRNHIDNGDFAQWSNGTSAAPDGWTFYGHTGGAVAREGTIKKIGAYSAKLTSTTVAGEYKIFYQDVHDSFGIAYWRGRTVTVGAWLWCDTASAIRIGVNDGVRGASIYHPSDGQWHWITVTYTIRADASRVRPYALIDSGDGVSGVGYVDGMILVEGSYCPAFDPDGQRVNALIYKNGVLVTYGTVDYQGAGTSSSIASDLIYMNGTTDYLELYAYNSHSSALTLYTGYPYQNYISIVGPF